MNFAHYYNILQQIEKPTFVFDRFNLSITFKYTENLDEYLIKNDEHYEIKRKIFNLVSAHFYLLYRSEYVEDNLIKFYDLPNFYLLHSNILLNNQKYNKAINTIAAVENSDIKILNDICKSIIKGNAPMILDIVDITRALPKNCYFNITTTEKDYFTLEIIAVIHKIIA
jgi:hypothetical protein